MVFYLLFESSVGYSLFERREVEEIGSQISKVQESWMQFGRFNQICILKGFLPFPSPDKALENINDISEGILNPFLQEFLEQNISNMPSHTLGVAESSLGSSIESQLGLRCLKDSAVLELLRFVRHHFEAYLGTVSNDQELLLKSQRGLGHSYSRAKIKFDVNKSDNMIIQSISLLDQLDKDINTFAMRVREWYSWHFPELIKIENDNIIYARLARAIQDRTKITDAHYDAVLSIVGDPQRAGLIITASKSSMGYEVSEFDIISVVKFADRVVHLAEYRKSLSDYLHKKMIDVAPNLTTLIGDIVGARLINRAGSLMSLAKYPASTVQILGAEKALFRALKSRGNTPKYGLIFNSTFIGRAKAKDKGRISRYLANKCVIASRLDALGDISTTKFGEALRQQVEDRLKFYETGETPAKNIEVMKQVSEEVKKMEVISQSDFVPEVSRTELGFGGVLFDGSSTLKREKSKDKEKKKRRKSK